MAVDIDSNYICMSQVNMSCVLQILFPIFHLLLICLEFKNQLQLIPVCGKLISHALISQVNISTWKTKIDFTVSNFLGKSIFYFSI